MMMVKESKHTDFPRCKFHNSGFCKFRDHCRKRHFSSVCQVPNCSQDCEGRHPRLCKLESSCKFYKKGICAYKHITLTNNDKIEDLEKQLKHLRDQINDLTEQNKQKLKLIEKITAEKSEIIDKLSKENHDLKLDVEYTKKFHAKIIESKNNEVKNLQEQNQRQKDRIVEMEARLKNMNSPLKEQNNQKHLKIDENAKTIDCFTCDKCGFNTNSLATLVQHKTNEHNQVLSCDHCDFKSFKKTDLQIHLTFKH